jgi:hypothetical protein
MKRNAVGSFFGALRRRRRAVLLGVLPALGLVAASSGSCLAMPVGPAMATAHVPCASQSAHAGAPTPHEAATHASPNGAPCPHCGGHDRIAHAACATDARVGPALDATHAPYKVAKAILHDLAPWPAVIGPLPWPSARAGPARSPPGSARSINLRHCVLLI